MDQALYCVLKTEISYWYFGRNISLLGDGIKSEYEELTQGFLFQACFPSLSSPPLSSSWLLNCYLNEMTLNIYISSSPCKAVLWLSCPWRAHFKSLLLNIFKQWGLNSLSSENSLLHCFAMLRNKELYDKQQLFSQKHKRVKRCLYFIMPDVFRWQIFPVCIWMRSHIGVLFLLTHKSKVIWKKISRFSSKQRLIFPPLSVTVKKTQNPTKQNNNHNKKNTPPPLPLGRGEPEKSQKQDKKPHQKDAKKAKIKQQKLHPPQHKPMRFVTLLYIFFFNLVERFNI